MKRFLVLSLLLIPAIVWGYIGIGFIGGSPGVDWDILDEDCVDISDWSDNDTAPAVSEVDPAGQFRFDTNAGAAGNDFAQRSRTLGSYPNEFTLETKLYHDDIGTEANNDSFQLLYRLNDERFKLTFASDGLFVTDTDSGETEVGTNLVKEDGSAEWQIWRFLATFTGVMGEATCDVYLDDSTHTWEKVGTSIPCSYEGSGTPAGEINIYQFGNTTDNMTSHVNYIKAATGLYIP